jgi:hypothetical protein
VRKRALKRARHAEAALDAPQKGSAAARYSREMLGTCTLGTRPWARSIDASGEVGATAFARAMWQFALTRLLEGMRKTSSSQFVEQCLASLDRTY